MGKYDDMLGMEHPASRKHPRMSLMDRAAQFAPFAALTGHGTAIKETERWTDERMELTEDEISCINLRLMAAEAYVGTDEVFNLLYFVPDGKKSGGSYMEITGSIQKLDRYAGLLFLSDGTQVPIESIAEISGKVLL